MERGIKLFSNSFKDINFIETVSVNLLSSLLQLKISAYFMKKNSLDNKISKNVYFLCKNVCLWGNMYLFLEMVRFTKFCKNFNNLAFFFYN